jgi:hypothetical protein
MKEELYEEGRNEGLLYEGRKEGLYDGRMEGLHEASYE